MEDPMVLAMLLEPVFGMNCRFSSCFCRFPIPIQRWLYVLQGWHHESRFDREPVSADEIIDAAWLESISEKAEQDSPPIARSKKEKRELKSRK